MNVSKNNKNKHKPCKVITHFCFSQTLADLSHEPLIREPNLPAAKVHTKIITAKTYNFVLYIKKFIKILLNITGH